MSNIRKTFFIHPLCAIPFILIFILFPDKYTLIELFTVCIHESGHIAAASALNLGIKRISLLPGGLEIHTRFSAKHRLSKIVIGAAGCVANAFAALLSFIVSHLFSVNSLESAHFIFCNILICCFNMLPIKGLDGGEITEQILDKFFLPDTVYKVLKSSSLIFTFALWIVACYILLTTSSNVSLFTVCLVLFFSNCRD